MASKKQREVLRRKRVEFTRKVEENRKALNCDLSDEKSEPTNVSTSEKKTVTASDKSQSDVSETVAPKTESVKRKTTTKKANQTATRKKSTSKKKTTKKG